MNKLILISTLFLRVVKNKKTFSQLLNLTWKQIDREGDQPGKCLRGKKSRKVFIGRLHCNNIIIDHEDGYRKNIACFAHNEFHPHRFAQNENGFAQK